MADTIPLTSLAYELAGLSGQPAPTYRRLYHLVLDGRLPAEQVNGRYRVRRDDLPVIAERLGLPTAARQSVAA